MKKITNSYSKNSIFATDDTECYDNYYKYIVTDNNEGCSPFIKYITFKNRFADSGLNELDLINIVVDRLENFIDNTFEYNPNVDYAFVAVCNLKEALSNIAKLK